MNIFFSKSYNGAVLYLKASGAQIISPCKNTWMYKGDEVLVVTDIHKIRGIVLNKIYLLQRETDAPDEFAETESRTRALYYKAEIIKLGIDMGSEELKNRKVLSPSKRVKLALDVIKKAVGKVHSQRHGSPNTKLTLLTRLKLCFEILTIRSGHAHTAQEKQLSTFMNGYHAGQRDLELRLEYAAEEFSEKRMQDAASKVLHHKGHSKKVKTKRGSALTQRVK